MSWCDIKKGQRVSERGRVNDFWGSSLIGMVSGVIVEVLVGKVFKEGVIWIGFEEGRCKVKEEVSEEFLGSVETEEETEEVESVELENKTTGESRMETRRVLTNISKCF